jgi:hypothetical protein
MLLALQEQTSLSPARVICVAGNRVQLEFPDERTWATVALAYPYQPAVGDSVLAIGQGDQWYVIGVLEGSGKTTITVPGDLAIRAPAGKIELAAGRGLKLKGPTVRIVAGKLEVVARSAFERFSQATLWVKETLKTRTRRMRTRVEGTFDLNAGRILERADGDVKIDGSKIHLG